MLGKLTRVFNRLGQLRRMCATVPYYGFVTGHGYLTDAQVDDIRRLVDNPATGAQVVADYERAFVRAIAGSQQPGQGMALAGGRMALWVILKALGIGPGDEVIVPGFTCAVVASAILRTGATPVYTDVDPDTFGTSPDAVTRAMTPRTRAVIAQHSFGIPCKADQLRDITTARDIALIEDCALTLGSTLNGTPVGHFGDAAFFSTDHSKPLNTLVGGFLYTRNAELFAKAQCLVEHADTLPADQQQRLFNQFLLERRLARPASYGIYQLAMLVRSVMRKIRKRGMTFLDDDYTVERSGAYPYPARMPAMLARLGLHELERWPAEARRRADILTRYVRAAQGTPVEHMLPAAYTDPARHIVGHRFAYRHPKAEDHHTRMDARVHTAWTWFPVPVLGATQGLASLGYHTGACPVSEQVGQGIVNWPCVIEADTEKPLLDFFATVARQG